MRISYAKLALATVMSAMVVAPFASASAQQSSSVKIDISLVDMDMMTATRTLFERTGVQFVVEPGIEEFKKVTLKLVDVSPEDAIRYICQAAGASFRRDESGVYIISHSKPAPVATTAAPVAAPKVKVFKKIKVLRAGARDVYDAVLRGMPYDGERGFEDLRRFTNSMQAQDHLKRTYGPQFNIMGAVPLSQTFGPAQQAPTQTLPLVGAETGNQVVMPGESSNQRGGGGAGFGGGGLGQGGGNLGGGGGLGQGGGNLGGGGLGQGGGNQQLVPGTGLVGAGIDFISYDPNDNSIIVRGDDDDINQLQSYISQFDVAPRQLEIKVEFITTTDNMQKSLGYDFLYSRGTVNAGTRPGLFAKSSDPVFVNYSTGNIATRLRASLTDGQGKVVTSPIVRTLNNQPVSITSTVLTWVFFNTTTISNGTVVNQTNPQQITIQTSLSVSPRINEDGTITVFLSPQLSNITGSATGPNGEQYPITTQQVINVVARVRNNDTIVLGGLNSKNETSNTNRVPVLSELPIIGQFFRSVSRSRDNSELLIFVTPHIIEDDATNGNP